MHLSITVSFERTIVMQSDIRNIFFIVIGFYSDNYTFSYHEANEKKEYLIAYCMFLTIVIDT